VAFAGGDTPIALSAFQFFKRDPEHDRERKQVPQPIFSCDSRIARRFFVSFLSDVLPDFCREAVGA
jgi:hypothetical protein